MTDIRKLMEDAQSSDAHVAAGRLEVMASQHELATKFASSKQQSDRYEMDAALLRNVAALVRACEANAEQGVWVDGVLVALAKLQEQP